MPASLQAILGPVVFIDEGFAQAPSPVARSQFSAASAVPVAPGEETLSVRVTVSFSLEGP